MLADIATGKTGFADIMFLVALICFVLEFLVRLLRQPDHTYPLIYAMAGLACLSLGFLVL